MIVQIVRFKSELPEDQIMQMYNKRVPRYRELKGLKQKYYLKYPATNEYGAVYLWETESAMKEFRESELGKTIASTYKVQGKTEVIKAEMVMALHND